VSAAIVRHPLLTAPIAGKKLIDRVEVKRLDFVAGQQTALHTHPCPVVSIVTHGVILFQVEGQELRVIQAGEVIFEPADVRSIHFDAASEPATIVAFYLLGFEDWELISMLK